MSCFALIAGGGTGGHVQPALAVAEALVEAGRSPEEICFVGSERGMEGRLVRAAGFEIVLLPGRGIQRRLTAENITSARGIAVACAKALRLVSRLKPRVVITVGGYAGFPGAFAALLWRVPVVVVSYDAVPGAANKLIGRFAAANAVAYPGSGLPFARVTGPPVRPSVLAVDRSRAGRQEASGELGIDPENSILLVTGGSLGARSLNEAAVGLAKLWRDREGMTIYHVAGERNFAAVKDEAESGGLIGDGCALDYRLVGYEDRMPSLLAACDLAVARAGASTVAEFVAVGVPSALVPLPKAPSDHQAKNAKALADAGAAVTIPDAECGPERLAATAGALLGDPALLSSMSRAAQGLGRRDAAAQIALIAESVALEPLLPRGRRRIA